MRLHHFAVLAAVAVFAACGQQTEESPDASASTTAAGPTPSEPPPSEGPPGGEPEFWRDTDARWAFNPIADGWEDMGEGSETYLVHTTTCTVAFQQRGLDDVPQNEPADSVDDFADQLRSMTESVEPAETQALSFEADFGEGTPIPFVSGTFAYTGVDGVDYSTTIGVEWFAEVELSATWSCPVDELGGDGESAVEDYLADVTVIAWSG